MKVRIGCGARDWDDIDYIWKTFSELSDPKKDVLIHGGAPGADCILEMCAFAMGYTSNRVIRVDAKWEEQGRAAGPIRNSKMLSILLELTEGHPGRREVVAYHPFLDNSRGTRDMVDKARKKGVEVILLGGAR